MENNKKATLILLNGVSGSGKDAFVDIMQHEVTVCANFHRSDPFKGYLKSIGWNGVKDEKSRTALKYLVDIGEESGYNEGKLCNVLLSIQIANWARLEEFNTKILFYHVRDIGTIKHLKQSPKVIDCTAGVYSMLIYRDSQPTEPNSWYDVNAHKNEYDWVIYNDGTLQDLSCKATKFYKMLKEGQKHGEI